MLSVNDSRDGIVSIAKQAMSHFSLAARSGNKLSVHHQCEAITCFEHSILQIMVSRVLGTMRFQGHPRRVQDGHSA